MNTTVGQLLINEALPEDMRSYRRTLDKGGIKDLMEELATKHPDEYRDVVQRLHQAGQNAVQVDGSSLSIAALRPPKRVSQRTSRLKAAVIAIVNSDLPREVKDNKITTLVSSATGDVEDLLYSEATKEKNPFAIQVLSGSRGGKADLRSLVLGDLLVSDHRERIIPTPILHGYAEGLDPAEYWAGSYGARKGTVYTKFATQRAGFLGKQLVQAAHRLVVTEDDCKTDRGVPRDPKDPDVIGSVLSKDYGPYDAGTIVSPRISKALRHKRILVRSPLICQADRGICKRCAGVREKGRFPSIGENIGVAAATSLTEQISQAMLNQKHKGGRADREEEDGVQGFELVDQLVQVPKSFREAATIARLDGTIQDISDLPQGGKRVLVNDQEHYIPAGYEPRIRPGDRVEAGDILSEGIPNPAELVKYRGVGAGRLAFVDEFQKAYQGMGLKASRRNIEALARGLVNHVRVNALDGPEGALPNDVVEYQTIEKNYRPRFGFRIQRPKMSKGWYLEKPVMHYTIGTRVTNRMAKALEKGGIKEITVHQDEPSFSPIMIRAMENLTNAPDWRVRLGGSFLQKGLLSAVHRGTGSARGTSYIPGLAESKDFGKKLETEGVY